MIIVILLQPEEILWNVTIYHLGIRRKVYTADLNNDISLISSHKIGRISSSQSLELKKE